MFTIKKFSDYQILTDNGFVDFEGISKSVNPCNIIRFTLESGLQIKVNYEHEFIVDGMVQKAKEFIEGEPLQINNSFETIKNIEYLVEKDFVYDILEVHDREHSYLSNGIKSHNCKFLGSSSTLVDSDILERIEISDPVEVKQGGALLIYEYPQEGAFYVEGIDSSGGTGKDSSVITVLKIVGPHEVYQVATYRNNMISPYDFAQVCIGVAEYYNNAYMMVESNGQEAGEVAATIWHTYEYENMCNCDKKGLGIRSTKKSKNIANLLLKEYMEKGWLKVVDKTTVYELTRYVEHQPGIYRSETETCHDDTVLALAWALYFIKTPFYDGDVINRTHIESRYKIEDDAPAMIFDDGGKHSEHLYDSDWGDWNDEGDLVI